MPSEFWRVSEFWMPFEFRVVSEFWVALEEFCTMIFEEFERLMILDNFSSSWLLSGEGKEVEKEVEKLGRTGE